MTHIVTTPLTDLELLGDGRMVVGVDGSDANRAALRRAAFEAAAHAATLEIVHAWSFLAQPSSGFDPHYGADAARAIIEHFVDGAIGSTRRLDATLRVVNDRAGAALVEASSGASMVVVGARGMGALKGALLGSVSQHLVHHAHCPVLVVR